MFLVKTTSGLVGGATVSRMPRLNRPFFANFNFLLTDVARSQPYFSHSSTNSHKTELSQKNHPSTINHLEKAQTGKGGINILLAIHEHLINLSLGSGDNHQFPIQNYLRNHNYC